MERPRNPRARCGLFLRAHVRSGSSNGVVALISSTERAHERLDGAVEEGRGRRRLVGETKVTPAEDGRGPVSLLPRLVDKLFRTFVVIRPA